MTRDSLSKVFCINSGFLKKVVLEDPYAISLHFLPFLNGAFKEFSLSVYILYRVRRPEKLVDSGLFEAQDFLRSRRQG